MAVTTEQIDEQARAGWKAFARFLSLSTAGVVLVLIFLALTLL